MGSFNNNSTTTQFKSAYEKLIVNKTCVFLSSQSNCTPQHNMLLLTDGINLESFDNDAITYGISKKYCFNKKKEISKSSGEKKRKKSTSCPKFLVFQLTTC